MPKFLSSPSEFVQYYRVGVWLVFISLLSGATCSQNRNQRDQEKATIHYDMGVQAFNSKDSRMALIEFQKAVELDPDFAQAHHALGLTYHLSFNEFDKSIFHYQQALKLDPKFSEVYTNLGNVYLAEERYSEAIPLYEKALSDIVYKTPYIAENSLGWCYYKNGEVQKGIAHIQKAIAANPEFCLGHRNLGLIYTELRQSEKAKDSFRKYAKHCSQTADARYQYGRALLAAGNEGDAKREFESCAGHGRSTIGEDCQRLLGQLTP